MAEENDKFDELYDAWLKEQNLSSWNKDKAREYFNDHNGSLEGLKVEIEEQREETSTISHREENDALLPENDQIIKNSWIKYCRDNGLLEPDFKDDSLNFALYKDNAAKQQDDYIAKMKYEDKGLNVTTQKGKLPDFKFFQQTAKIEKERGKKSLKVESENPEFKAMMLAAALESGLDIGKEAIDLNLESIKKLPEPLRGKIAAHNQTVVEMRENTDTLVSPHAKTQELRDKIEKLRQLRKEKKFKEADALLTPEQIAEQKRRRILRSKNPEITEDMRNQNRLAGLEKRQKTASPEQQQIINNLINKYRGNDK